jgi:hypothetical protein
MSTSYPEQASPVSDPTPAYYAIIPATVRYHADLPPAAKLFFGELTALCSVEGFCWASNDYFMRLYSVSRATIKNWLSALSQAGFIRVEIHPNRNQRRIYLVETVPGKSPSKTITNVAKKVATGGKKISYPRSENLPQSIKENIKTIPKNVNVVHQPSARFVGPGPVPAREVNKPLVYSEEDRAVTASPSSRTHVALHPVEEVVELTGDTHSRKRFQQLRRLVEQNALQAVWDSAYNATKTALEGRSGSVGNSGAYFVSIVADGLESANVPVPRGSRGERGYVKQQIAQSFAVAGASAGVAAAPDTDADGQAAQALAP